MRLYDESLQGNYPVDISRSDVKYLVNHRNASRSDGLPKLVRGKPQATANVKRLQMPVSRLLRLPTIAEKTFLIPCDRS